ncbi:hypothetical protein R3P38DRAFT_552203 [Favolaschia claudopus]|uniref:GATA-type domain-containing protein n=1 Tax=Favolaschia claudopus TaxID=2862362 RepID=A0AAV9ZB24_9AGAR
MSSIDRKQSRAPGAARYGNGLKAATQTGTAASYGGNTQSEDRIQPQPDRSYSFGSFVDTSLALTPSAPQSPPNDVDVHHAGSRIPQGGRRGVLASSPTATVDSFPAHTYTATSSSITSQQWTPGVYPPSASNGGPDSSGSALPLPHHRSSPPSSNDYQLACQSVMNLLKVGGLNATAFVEHFSRYHIQREPLPLPQLHHLPQASHPQPPSPSPPIRGAHTADDHPPMSIDPALLTGPSAWLNVTSPSADCGFKHDAEVESIPTDVVDVHASVSTRGDSNGAGPSKMASDPRARSASQNGGVMKAVSRKCFHCQKTETPQWRLHPTIRVDLCNYCGQKAYKTHGTGKRKAKMLNRRSEKPHVPHPSATPSNH